MNKKMKALAVSASTIGMYLLLPVKVVLGAVDTGEQGTQAPQFDTDIPDGYAANFGSLLSFILRAVLAVGALLVFAYLVLGGIEYITSGGDKGKTEKARDKITSAVIGLIILAASWAILNLALSFLGLGSLVGALESVGTINRPVNQ